ncbi:MAG: DNA-3-methyladenine glycosylase I [Bacteroidales bacterium]|jgi:DNA-3-methyladenine glycosylase I|nr:DNA-3-methyladenine glycosylase I [Bacteroidales bacterium]
MANYQDKSRCGWIADELMQKYHDEEWGVPLHDDRKLFEFMVLDAFQAGLSWKTILNKRENFRNAFDDFDPEKIAAYDDRQYEKLLNDAGIIRNRAKINATISNARAFIKVREEFGSFDHYIWSFVDYKPVVNNWQSLSDLPAKTELSDRMSKDLTRRGFKFVGSTICYAFMQAAGMVNDHVVDCFRHKEVDGR